MIFDTARLDYVHIMWVNGYVLCIKYHRNTHTHTQLRRANYEIRKTPMMTSLNFVGIFTFQNNQKFYLMLLLTVTRCDIYLHYPICFTLHSVCRCLKYPFILVTHAKMYDWWIMFRQMQYRFSILSTPFLFCPFSMRKSFSFTRINQNFCDDLRFWLYNFSIDRFERKEFEWKWQRFIYGRTIFRFVPFSPNTNIEWI